MTVLALHGILPAMRTVNVPGMVAIVVLSVAAGTVLGILLDRSLLQKPAPAATTAAPSSVATNGPSVAITAAEVPHHFARLSKLGQSREGIRQAQDFAQNLAPDAFPAAIEHINTLDAFLRQWVLLRIFERWGHDDPVAALAATVKVPPVHQSNCQNAVFGAWAKRDAHTLIAWAEGNTNSTTRRDAFLYAARELANQNPKAALDAALKLPQPQRKDLWQAIFGTWISKAPEAALKEMAALSSDPELQRYHQAALLHWMQQDARPALAWLKQQPDDALRPGSIRHVAHLMGTADPVTGYQLIQSLPGGYDRQTAVGSLAGSWVRQDSNAALNWARNLSDAADKDAAMVRIIEQLGDVDPKAGAELIAQDPSSRAARQSTRSFAARYVKVAPDAASAWAEKLPAGETRDEALETILKITAEQSPAKAAAAATNLLTGFRRDVALRDIVRNWAAAEPAAAATFCASLPIGRERNEMLNSVVRTWAEQNPPAAMDWVLTLESGAARREADKLVVDALAKTDPPTAAQFVDKLPTSEAKATLLTTVLDFWMPKNFDAAAAWVETLADEELKQRGYERLANYMQLSDPARAARFAEKTDRKSHTRSLVAGRWAESDPRAAAAWALQQGTNRTDDPLPFVISAWAKKSPPDAASYIETLPVERRRNVGYGLISGWTERDPRAAGAWVLERSPEELRGFLMRDFINGWARRDANAAVAWVRDLRAGQLRDTAASSLVNSLADDSAKLAAELAELIADPSKRNYALENVGRQWLRNAPAEARAWIATNSLPPARKEQLLKNLKQ